MSNMILLGTGTCQIEMERRASSVLLELEQTHILFDCGHGVVQRLLEVGIKHNELHHIVFSHFHPDHVSDIIPFLQAGAHSKKNPRTSDLHLYGPKGLRDIIDGILKVFGTHSLQQPGYNVVIHEISREAVTIGPYQFESLSLPPVGNRGLRFTWNGKRYALTGDSHFHDEEIAFLQDVDLAVIDAGHLDDEQIARLAAASQAKVIVCSHLYRKLKVERLQDMAARKGYQGTIVQGHDLMTFVL